MTPNAVIYQDVKNWIHSIVWQFCARHPEVDQDDCLSVANMGFMLAMDKYDGRTEVTTWLGVRIRFNLLSMLMPRKMDTLVQYSGDQELFDGPRNLERRPLMEKVEELSEDAIFVVGLALEAPAEVVALQEGKTRRGAIRSYLRSLGWSLQQVRDSFTEIREVLNDET